MTDYLREMALAFNATEGHPKVASLNKEGKKIRTEEFMELGGYLKTLQDEIDDLLKIISDGKGFEELMSMREDDKDIRFMIKEKDNKIDEFFMVLGGDDEFALLSVFGDGIDLNMLYKLSKVVGIDTFNELEKLENRGGR